MELHRPTGRTRLGLFYASVTMLLWGVLPHALKLTLLSMDALTITWYRCFGAALLLGAVLGQRGRLPALRVLPRDGWRLLAVAIVFLAGNYVCFLLGLHHTTPANSQVLIQLAPVLLAVGGVLVFRERLTPLQWLGFAVLVIGLTTFAGAQVLAVAGDAGRYYLGSFLMLIAALAWSVYGLAQKQLLSWLPAQGIMVCIYAGCALLLVPFAAPEGLLHMDGLGLGMLAFCTLNTLVAYGALSEALVHWEASRVGAVVALTPVVTIASGSAVHALWPRLAPAVTLSPAGLGGAGLVVVGSLITALGGRGASPSVAESTPAAQAAPANPA